jgi:hypothetical protein
MARRHPRRFYAVLATTLQHRHHLDCIVVVHVYRKLGVEQGDLELVDVKLEPVL